MVSNVAFQRIWFKPTAEGHFRSVGTPNRETIFVLVQIPLGGLGFEGTGTGYWSGLAMEQLRHGAL